MSGPSSGPDEPVWLIIDTQKPQPGSKIIEYVRGRANAQRRVDELNAKPS
jgi:hypothetical protein